MQSLNLLVFRDHRKLVDGNSLKAGLCRRIQELDNSALSSAAMDSLLLAGELESATADCDPRFQEFQRITDSLAEAVVNPEVAPEVKSLLDILNATPVPKQLRVSVPEGFAYYALHPLAFADVLDFVPNLCGRVTVLGIRTIGTTLSAVTTAAARKRGLSAERITVRPVGHPYNRYTQFSPQQADFVKTKAAEGSGFLVVDEGPGLSGSSFLSVAEALLQACVPRDSITLICSHEPDPDQLCADNAAQRSRQFRWIAVPPQTRRPQDARLWIGAGEWRRSLISQESSWPASWLSFERLKYASDRDAEPRFYKFLGFGHYGRKVLERETEIAAAGFAAAPRIESDGFASYPFVHGRPMSATDLSDRVLERLAAYCAWRADAFPADSADLIALQQMAKHNLQELQLDVPLNLQLERPVIADGRMLPHEWLFTGTGQMLKTDCGSHGDDHFFPGACDIAWDLASAIVEWHMSPAIMKAFLEMYRCASGDDAEKRIADYITAYAVFRYAYCLMAANAMQGTEEGQRLETSAAAYGTRLGTEEIELAPS